MTYKRIFLIVMDSVGIGEAPDAEKFGDKGTDTLGHIAEKMGGLNCIICERETLFQSVIFNCPCKNSV